MQGAVSMAEWEMQHGSDPELLNMSPTIIATQTQEISEMQQILTTLPVPADCMTATSPSMVPAPICCIGTIAVI